MELENEACNQRYAKSLKASHLFPMATKVHVLRSMYAAYVYHYYLCQCTFNFMAMKCLGHETVSMSLSYNSVVLHDAGSNGCLGPLP